MIRTKYLQRFGEINQLERRKKKFAGESYIFHIQKVVGCVHCRSRGLQQLLLITMQNNPSFVHRNRNVAAEKEGKKRRRLTLFRSFSIYKRP